LGGGKKEEAGRESPVTDEQLKHQSRIRKKIARLVPTGPKNASETGGMEKKTMV